MPKWNFPAYKTLTKYVPLFDGIGILNVSAEFQYDSVDCRRRFLVRFFIDICDFFCNSEVAETWPSLYLFQYDLSFPGIYTLRGF